MPIRARVECKPCLYSDRSFIPAPDQAIRCNTVHNCCSNVLALCMGVPSSVLRVRRSASVKDSIVPCRPASTYEVLIPSQGTSAPGAPCKQA